MGWAPSWSVLPLAYASLFSKVWVFRRRNCRPLWCQTDDCYRYAMRAAGFATMGIAHEPWLLWFHACFRDSAARCLIRRVRRWCETNPSTTTWSFFLAVDDAGSAGAVIGALLGSWLLQYDFRWSAPQGQFCLCCVQHSMRGFTGMETLHCTHARSRRHDPRMRDKRFVTYVLTLAGYYMLAYK